MKAFNLLMMASSYGGGGSIPSSLPTVSAQDSAVDPDPALAILSFQTDGTITAGGSGPNSTGNWATPTTAGIGNSYYVKIVVSSGSVSGMTSGTWYALSTFRTFSKIRSTPGTEVASGTYFISTAGSDGTIIGDLDGGAWSLSATQDT